MQAKYSRKVLGETLCVVGLVFAVFGVYELWLNEPFTPGRRAVDKLLLTFFDRATAMLVFACGAIVFGLALAALGGYVLLKEKRAG